MSNEPADIANQALDAIGSDAVLGDLEDGTNEAQVCLRAYGNCMRQLLRAAHWNFARKQAPLLLLADATGATSTVPRTVPIPWVYEYAYPNDCVKARFIPWNYGQAGAGVPPGNITVQNPNLPLVGSLGAQPLSQAPLRFAKFILGTDPNFPAQPGQIWWETNGVSPIGSTVILTNTPYAQLVYTMWMPYPNMWDPLFRAAMVAYLASEVALKLTKEKKFGLELRREQINIAKAKITEARVANGNEGPRTSDIPVDWMNTRNTGGLATWREGAGYLAGWDSCTFSDGSIY